MLYIPVISFERKLQIRTILNFAKKPISLYSDRTEAKKQS